MTILMLLAFAAFLLIIIAKPKWGSFLIWPILFCYPHGWWASRGFLPLGAGADDVFCIFLFIVVLLRRNLMEGVPFRFGYAFWTITSFVMIALVATFFGSRQAPSYERILYVRDMLKLVIYWCLFYAIIHCIDDEYDLRRQLFMFSGAAVAGAVLVIATYYMPYRLEAFLAPVTVEKGMADVGARASGAFMNPNSAAGTLACAVALMIASMKLSRHQWTKIISYGSIFVLFAAIMMTRSRSGFFALGIVLVLMAVAGRYKKVGWSLIIVGVVVGFFFVGARELFRERLGQIYDPMVGAWAQNVEGRFSTWSSYFETASARDYLVGQGSRRGIVKNATESHSAYVSLITVYGIGGLVWGVVILFLFLRKYTLLKEFPDPFIHVMASGCLWALMIWGLYAMTADALSSYYPRYVLFFTVVLLGRTYAIAQHKVAAYYAAEAMDESVYEAGRPIADVVSS